MKKLGGSKVSAASAPWSPNGVVASRASIRVTSGAAPPAAAIRSTPLTDDPDVAPRRLVREPGGPRRFAHLPRRPHARNGDRQPVEVEVHGPLGDLPAAIASYGELRAQPAVDPRCLDRQRAELRQPPVGERADRATDDRDVAVGARGDVVDPQLREPVREVGWEEVVDAVAAQRVEQICHGRRAGVSPRPRLRHRASGRPGNPVRCWVHSDGVEAARASSWTTPSALAVCGRNRP